jgi:hypothetical protein
VARKGCALVRAHLVGTASRVVDLAAGEGIWLEAAREQKKKKKKKKTEERGVG